VNYKFFKIFAGCDRHLLMSIPNGYWVCCDWEMVMRDAKGYQSCGAFVKTVPVYCTCRPKCEDGYHLIEEIEQRCDETRRWSPLYL